jgi:hypothetical protein
LLLDTIVYAESMNIWAAELGWSGWYGKIWWNIIEIQYRMGFSGGIFINMG